MGWQKTVFFHDGRRRVFIGENRAYGLAIGGTA
jgi:hypothetical protein